MIKLKYSLSHILLISLVFGFSFNSYLLSNDKLTTHGLSMFGDIKYKNNFKYFDYVKVGLPLALILWIVSVMVIPMIFIY